MVRNLEEQSQKENNKQYNTMRSCERVLGRAKPKTWKTSWEPEGCRREAHTKTPESKEKRLPPRIGKTSSM